MIHRFFAALSISLAATACAARGPRLPEAGDRVRVWTSAAGEATDSDRGAAEIGDLVGISPDSLTISSEDDSASSMAWSAVEALEIDVASGWRALRVYSCAMIPVGVVLTTIDLVGDERNSERALLSSIYTVAFGEECFFPGPRWRTARIPRAVMADEVTSQ